MRAVVITQPWWARGTQPGGRAGSGPWRGRGACGGRRGRRNPRMSCSGRASTPRRLGARLSGHGVFRPDRRGRARVSGWQEGDSVCALLAGGGYAELVAVPPGSCCRSRMGEPDRRRRPAGGGVHNRGQGVPGPSWPPGRYCWCTAARAGSGPWRSSSRRPRDAGGLHRRYPGEAGALPRTGRRPGDFLPRRRLRGGRAEFTGGRGADVILDIMGAPYLARNLSAGHRGAPGADRNPGRHRAEIDLGLLMRKRARSSPRRCAPARRRKRPRSSPTYPGPGLAAGGRGPGAPVIERAADGRGARRTG